jgi:hypothetical protein
MIYRYEAWGDPFETFVVAGRSEAGRIDISNKVQVSKGGLRHTRREEGHLQLLP